MIISVHLPKTAGKSFEATLKTHFGSALLEDYATFPMNTARYERSKSALEASLVHAETDFGDVACVHGHFLPARYLLLAVRRKLTFVTWMRHPVQRMLSNYHYWKRTYDPVTSPPLHRRVVEEDWSVERFCLGEEMRNMYDQFLWAFPVGYFDFIGVTEFYDEDLAAFACRYLGGPVAPQRLNSGTTPGLEYELDAVLRRRVEDFHARDMTHYEYALRARTARASA